MQIIVLIISGALAQIITVSPGSTSAFISWSQPPFSFPPVGYIVSVSRVTGEDQMYCTMIEDSKPPVNTTSLLVRWTELQEFSIYNVTVSAVFMEFGLSTVASASLLFNTHDASMCP